MAATTGITMYEEEGKRHVAASVRTQFYEIGNIVHVLTDDEFTKGRRGIGISREVRQRAEAAILHMDAPEEHEAVSSSESDDSDEEGPGHVDDATVEETHDMTLWCFAA